MIPEWDLQTLYKNLECEEYKNDIEEYKSLIEQLNNELTAAASFDNNSFNTFLKTTLSKIEKLEYLSKTLEAFAYIIYSTDTTNTKYLNNISFIDELSNRKNQIEIKFSKILYTANNQNLFEAFYKENPEYTEYKFILEEKIKSYSHQMSESEELLAGDLQKTGGSSWDRLHEQLISNLKDENGKTFNELRNDAFSADPLLRKKSYEKEIELLKQNEISFAACLNNLKGETITLNKRRSWDTALERALFSNRLSKETLDALISAIEDSLPSFREYLKLKAKILHYTKSTASTDLYKENQGLAFYDLFAPLKNPAETNENESSLKKEKSLLTKEWTFEEAKEYILKEYNSFSTQMGDFAKKAFENNWIDAKVHEGKVGGAYDEDFPKNHESRILTNFTGTFSDIITLAHELGHAFHFSCMKNKSPLFFNYPMTLAETASTFAETIVKQDAIKTCEGFDKITLIELDLQDTCQVLVDILCRFYFEQSVFEQRENGELNAKDFCSLMKAAQEKTYGDGLSSEKHEYMWAVKSHYYSTDLDFYNFPYAFGQLFAVSLYQKFKAEGKAFTEKYSALLSETGNLSCEELCKRAGFDITTKDFWQNGIELYKEEIQILKKWTEENLK